MANKRCFSHQKGKEFDTTHCHTMDWIQQNSLQSERQINRKANRLGAWNQRKHHLTAPINLQSSPISPPKRGNLHQIPSPPYRRAYYERFRPLLPSRKARKHSPPPFLYIRRMQFPLPGLAKKRRDEYAMLPNGLSPFFSPLFCAKIRTRISDTPKWGPFKPIQSKTIPNKKWYAMVFQSILD